MKKILSLVALYFFTTITTFSADKLAEKSPPTMPEDVTLTSGRVLRKVQVVRWEKDRVVLKHGRLTEPVPFSLLTEPLRSQIEIIRMAQMSQAAPAAPNVQEARISGQVFFVTGGNSRAPKMAGVEVRAYPVEQFRSLDSSRTLPATHSSQLGSTLGMGSFMGDSRPDVVQLTQYMDDEYASWDSLPPPVASAVTDLDGRFSLALPAGSGPVTLFARHRLNSSYQTGGTRRFSYVWTAAANPTGDTILGNQQIHPDLAKALAIFFK